MAATRKTIAQVVGENVRASRLGADLSQEALAAKARLHRTEISMIERGVREPRLSTLKILADAMNTTLATLLEGVDAVGGRRRQRKGG